jgi:hypothetical protein
MRKATPMVLSDEKAARMLAALREGRTLRKFYVKAARLEAYFKLHPEYAQEALPLIAVNAKAAAARKGSARRLRTHCIKGHPLEKPRLWGGREYRHCAVCAAARARLGGALTRDQLKRVKSAIGAGMPISHFTGGGRPTYIVKHRTFLRYRNENPEFNRFVLEATKDNNCRAQKQRHQLQRMIVGGRVEQANDFHSVAAMVPTYLPAHIKDEIVQSVFLAILEKTLHIDDVPKRISEFVAAQHRMFPTKFAKFGDSPLVSLDEILFDDGSRTRADTVSSGLWD